MNKRQKEVLENSLENEKQVLNLLEKNYITALRDIKVKIKDLMDSEETQSKIYQIEYQKALEKQIKDILDILQNNNITTIEEYLKLCYEDTFIGALYDIQGQGIPLIIPINQDEVVKIINTPVGDIKLSERIHNNTSELKEVLKSEIARGISTGTSYWDIARNISYIGQTDLYKAQRIARTEGHRVQENSRFDAQKKAKEKGANIVKQWDSTLDSRTRESHRKLDGQIRELEESFVVNGRKAMYPGNFGRPEEDINCRCVSLQRAKWALDEEELETLKKRAEYFELDKTKDFEEFKSKYLKVSKERDVDKKSAAFYGAYNDDNDPYSQKRDSHASKYYESVRNRDKKLEITVIAENTGFSEKAIERIYNHIFINEYDLDEGTKRFDPDYDMSCSWARLREGKDIQEHDIIMLKHERLESYLMQRYNLSYRKAHNIVEPKYNYSKAVRMFNNRKRD